MSRLKLIGLTMLAFLGLPGTVFAGGYMEIGKVTKIKISTEYTEVFIEDSGRNPDSCQSSGSAVLFRSNPLMGEIYTSAMAAMNTMSDAILYVEGCSNIGNSSLTRPIISAITVEVL